MASFRLSGSGTQEKKYTGRRKKTTMEEPVERSLLFTLAIHNLKAETKIDSLFRIDDVTKAPALANRPLSMY